MNDYEVCTIWATDRGGARARGEGPRRRAGPRPAIDAPTATPRFEAWHARARTWCVRWREELMTPHVGTLLRSRRRPPRRQREPAGGRRLTPASTFASVSDFDALDFFRDESFVPDPYPYFDSPPRTSARCGGSRTTTCVMVTGYEEAVAVYNDTTTFSSCNSVTGPFPGLPRPARRRRRQRARSSSTATSCPFSDQLPTFDPPEAHRSPRAADAADHAEAAQGERGVHVAARRSPDRRVRRQGRVRVHQRVRRAVRAARDRRSARRARSRSRRRSASELQGAAAARAQSAAPTTRMEHSPLEFLYDALHRLRRGPAARAARRRAHRTRDRDVPRRVDCPRSSTSCASPPTCSRPDRRRRSASSATALQLIGEHPDLQQLLRDERERIPNFVEETLRIESPVKGDFRLSRVPTHDRRRRHPGGHHPDGRQRRREP